MRRGGPLVTALLVYGALAGLLAFCQRDRFNADFVAYAGIADQVLRDPAASVTGFWSPLFSWLMAPLRGCGLDALLAGRAVLLLAGAGYLLAIDCLARRLAPGSAPGRQLVRSGMLACAVLQAGVWSNFLLTADLLGNVFLFACFALLAGGSSVRAPGPALALGAAAGFAYLGKAYMLPFLLLLLPLALWLAPRLRADAGTTGPTPSLGRAVLATATGLLLVAGPWIAVLSLHYGAFTISTAGAANHANVGPEHWREDLLWNPPLGIGHILDPDYGPDWSPFASAEHAGHQLFLLGRNLLRGGGHVGSWIGLLALAMLARAHGRRRLALPPLAADMRHRVVACVVAGLLYLVGYCWILVERRYVVPTLAPLWCLAALLLLASLAQPSASPAAARRGTWLGLLLVLPFLLQEGRLALAAARWHPQSHDRACFAEVQAGLARAGHPDRRFAASDWHMGLGVAFAADAVGRYLGSPHADTPADRDAELCAAGAQLFLQFLPAGERVAPTPLPASWQHVADLPFDRPGQATPASWVKVYVRAE